MLGGNTQGTTAEQTAYQKGAEEEGAQGATAQQTAYQKGALNKT